MESPKGAGAMVWDAVRRSDVRCRKLADRHYSRQSPGHPMFVPPGRCLVLYAKTPSGEAAWATSWPFAEYVKHEWAGAWVCSLFRNEGAGLSSDLIRQAVAATCWKWESPPLGMVTFVDAGKIRRKRDPGRCFVRAGFSLVGETKTRGLLAFQILPADMPEATRPIHAQGNLFFGD